MNHNVLKPYLYRSSRSFHQHSLKIPCRGTTCLCASANLKYNTIQQKPQATMEDQVPFKVFTFWKKGGKPEVRRFGIEKTVVTSYHYLNAKIEDVYPGLKGREYSVAWKDEDGDDIIISSDDEVMTALQTLGGDLIKLYVYCRGDVDNDVKVVITATAENATAGVSGQRNTELHYGVMCDSCDAAVVGFRYKCTSCEDFDLCSRCEAEGRHPEHCMVRVPTPSMPRAVIKAAIKRSRHFLKTVSGAVGEDCAYKRHRRERSGERRHRGDHPSHNHTRPPHADHHRTRVSWLDTFATYMNEFANLAGDVDSDPTAPPKTGSQQKPKDPQPPKPETAPEQPKASTSSNTEPRCPLGPQINFKDLLESCLTANANQLRKPASSAPAAASPQTDVEMGQGDRKASKASDVTVKTEPSASSDTDRDSTPDKGDEWTMINQEKDFMDAAASAPQEPAPIGFNLPEEFQERVKISEGGLYPPLNTATAVLNPKEAEAAKASHVPQQSAQPQPAAKPAAQPETQSVAPAQQSPKPATAPPQPAQRQRHPKAHIEAAIQHMLAMGFTNDGAWLTQLLESKDGNIAAVLDLLTPVNPKK